MNAMTPRTDIDTRALARLRAEDPTLADIPDKDLRGTIAFAGARIGVAMGDLRGAFVAEIAPTLRGIGRVAERIWKP